MRLDAANERLKNAEAGKQVRASTIRPIAEFFGVGLSSLIDGDANTTVQGTQSDLPLIPPSLVHVNSSVELQLRRLINFMLESLKDRRRTLNHDFDSSSVRTFFAHLSLGIRLVSKTQSTLEFLSPDIHRPDFRQVCSSFTSACVRLSHKLRYSKTCN